MVGTVVRLRGLKRYKSAGILYIYHRASGDQLSPKHEPGSAEFLAAYAEAEAKVAKVEPVKMAGSLGAAIDRYLDSADFLTKRERTRRDYSGIIDWLRPLDAMPLRAIDKGFVYALRDKAFKQRRRRFANYVTTVLALILEHEVRTGNTIGTNPASGIRKIEKGSDEAEANVAWTQEEFAAVLAVAPQRLRGPLAVAWHLGLRQGDILKMGRTAIRDGVLVMKTSKTGFPLALPVPAPLLAELAAMPGHNAMTLFATSEGMPWDENAFRTALRRLMHPMKLAGTIRRELTFHGLRTTFAQRAAGRGIPTEKIAPAMGHASTTTTKGYVRQATAERDQAEVMATMANERRTRVSKRLSKPSDTED